MDAADLRARADAHRWYHTIDLGGGIVTRGVDNSPERLARLGLPVSLAGKTVLDVGAWDGFFSFEAERRGAARVVAWLAGRTHLVPTDIHAVAREALGHRIFFTPVYELRRAQISDELIAQILERVATPR